LSKGNAALVLTETGDPWRAKKENLQFYIFLVKGKAGIMPGKGTKALLFSKVLRGLAWLPAIRLSKWQ
jgi:hypothetical protein